VTFAIIAQTLCRNQLIIIINCCWLTKILWHSPLMPGGPWGPGGPGSPVAPFLPKHDKKQRTIVWMAWI